MAIIQNKAFRASVAMAASLMVIFSLSGCFANPLESILEQAGENVKKDGVEKIIEDATGADIELGGELPEGFPSEVPLIDREIVQAMSMPASDSSDGGWMVTMKVDDPAKALAEARQLFLDAGFEETVWQETGIPMGMFKNGKYGVTIGAIGDAGDDAIASYTVVHDPNN